jgi:hypothetical protein
MIYYFIIIGIIRPWQVLEVPTLSSLSVETLCIASLWTVPWFLGSGLVVLSAGFRVVLIIYCGYEFVLAGFIMIMIFAMDYYPPILPSHLLVGGKA